MSTIFPLQYPRETACPIFAGRIPLPGSTVIHGRAPLAEHPRFQAPSGDNLGRIWQVQTRDLARLGVLVQGATGKDAIAVIRSIRSEGQVAIGDSTCSWDLLGARIFGNSS
jgi:hypothetical protein